MKSRFLYSADDKVAEHENLSTQFRVDSVRAVSLKFSRLLVTAEGWVDPRAVQMRFVVETAKLEQGCLRESRVTLLTVILILPRIHLPIVLVGGQ